MVDVVNKTKRSQMMSGIQAKNTKPEIMVRKALFAQGYRYKLHDKKLPGKPDLVLPKYQTVIFVHGCFWHKHNCHLFKWPSTRPDFWKEKLNGNAKRDQVVMQILRSNGWKVLVIWECALKGKHKQKIDKVVNQTIKFVHNSRLHFEVMGKI